MGKVKIKRKSTLIDMTAMSDVTVLLLTFFMLTSTFLTPDPVKVETPSSVSEEIVPNSNFCTILVPPQPDTVSTAGRVYISFMGDTVNPTENLRVKILKKAVAIYNSTHKNSQIALPDTLEFAKMGMFGAPFKYLNEIVSMPSAERDTAMLNMEFRGGIPVNNNGSGILDWGKLQGESRKGGSRMNDLQIWLKALEEVAYEAQNEQVAGLEKQNGGTPLTRDEKLALKNLYNAIKQTGVGIGIKADKFTPWADVHLVFDNLQTMGLYKFSLMTTLKTETE